MPTTSRFAARGKTVDNEKADSKFVFSGSRELIEVAEEPWPSIILGWLKSAFGFAFFSALILAIAYSALSATVVHGINLDGKTGLVARGTFLGGVPAAPAVVYGSLEEAVNRDILQKLTSGFIGVPAPFVGQIKTTGAYDNIVVTDSKVYINGQFVEGSLVDTTVQTKPGDAPNYYTDATFTLSKQYVVQCQLGDCVKDALYIISELQISGEVKKWL